MKNVPMKINGIEFAVNGEIRVSSLEVASVFEKRHKDVLEAIRNLEEYDEFRGPDFRPSEYKTKQGKMQPCFNINRRGYSLLAMGFTGQKAFTFKARFIDAFEAMEQYIIDEQARKTADNTARLENPAMTKALKDMRQVLGKETKSFHYSNENNLVYRTALGATKKKYCEALDIPIKDRFRDHLSPLEIKMVEEIQRANTMLMEMGMEYKDRKEKLETLYRNKFSMLVKDDIDKIEA